MRSAGVRAVAPAGQRVALDNGMIVVVQESGAAPVVAMTLVVRVGSRDETGAANGVTALLGRTLLKGTTRRSALEVAQAAEGAGGTIETGVDQEYSEVRVRGLARHWRALLALVHEVVTAPRLAPEEIEREREGLLAQIRGLEDQPFQVASRLLNRALYGTHPYGLPTSGEVGTVRRLEHGDLAEHFEAFYSPERMVLAVSGDVPAREVLAEAGRLFGTGRRHAGAHEVATAPERPVRSRDREIRATQQAQLVMGFFAPPIGHPDHVALKLLNAVLGSGMSSRLFRVLRDQEGLAYSVGSFYPTRRGTGRLVVHIGTAPANVAAAEAGMRREAVRLGEEPVPDDELARTKAFVRGTFTLDLRTNASQSFYRGFFETMGVGHAYALRYPELVEAVSAADCQRVARRYLADPSVASAVVVVGPG